MASKQAQHTMLQFLIPKTSSLEPVVNESRIGGQQKHSSPRQPISNTRHVEAHQSTGHLLATYQPSSTPVFAHSSSSSATTISNSSSILAKTQQFHNHGR
jgi:hypothetical protein